MTAYPRIALPLFSYGCLVALVLSLGMLWETAFGGMPLSPFVISVCREQIVLGNVSWQFGLFSFVLRHLFLLGMGLGFDMKWVGVSRFFGPIIALQNPAVRLLGRRGGF